MSGGRIPGATCAAADPNPFDAGTSTRWWTPRPGPLVAPGGNFTPWSRSAPAPLWCPLPPDVSFLFNSCRNPARGLSDADFAAAATTLGSEVAAIQAVAEVESTGEGFDAQGRPRILYERHYFHRLTGGRYATAHPDLSNPQGGGYGLFRAQYGKLERAHALEPWSALQSVSWGRFQIMGSHYQRLGYATPQHMALALARAESEHLAAFVRFVQTDAVLLKALRDKDWVRFARAYNGSGYKKNAYDTKLAAAYARFSATPAPPTPVVPPR